MRTLNQSIELAVAAVERFRVQPPHKAVPAETDAEKLLRLEDEHRYLSARFRALFQAEFDLTVRRIAEGRLVAETYAQIQRLREVLGVDDAGRYGSDDVDEHVESLKERAADNEGDMLHDQQMEARLLYNEPGEEHA